MAEPGVQVHVVAEDESPVLLQVEAPDAHCPCADAHTRTVVPLPTLPPPNAGRVLLVTPPEGCVIVGLVSTAKTCEGEGGPSVLSAWRTVALTLYEPSEGTFTAVPHCHD